MHRLDASCSFPGASGIWVNASWRCLVSNETRFLDLQLTSVFPNTTMRRDGPTKRPHDSHRDPGSGKNLEKIIQECRRQYGDDCRSECEGRMRRRESFGLTEFEAELLFEAGVMPWDARTFVSDEFSLLSVVRYRATMANRTFSSRQGQLIDA